MAETARQEDVQPAPSPPGASPETTRTRPPQPDDEGARPDGPSPSSGSPASGSPAPAPDAQPDDAAPQTSPRRRAEAAAKAQAAAAADPRRGPGADDSAATYDDESVDDAGAVGVPVIQSVLGGTVIAEEED